jgi:hypothetical protein
MKILLVTSKRLRHLLRSLQRLVKGPSRSVFISIVFISLVLLQNVLSFFEKLISLQISDQILKNFLPYFQPPKVDPVQSAPISHPLFGQAPQQPQQPTNGYQDLGYNGQQYTPQPPMGGPLDYGQQQQQMNTQVPPQQQQQYAGQINYQNFRQHIPTQQQAPQMQQAPPQKVVEPPKPKMPLPEEYVYMQTVFDELKKQCINAAGNPVS